MLMFFFSFPTHWASSSTNTYSLADKYTFRKEAISSSVWYSFFLCCLLWLTLMMRGDVFSALWCTDKNCYQSKQCYLCLLRRRISFAKYLIPYIFVLLGGLHCNICISCYMVTSQKINAMQLLMWKCQFSLWLIWSQDPI